MRDAAYWIDRLGLERHPEGGRYRETYRSKESIPAGALPKRYGADRSFSTAIYYLLRSDERSGLHRLRSDEMFHFYAGSTLTVHVMDAGGEYRAILLGEEPDRGEVFQALVPAGSWFGATVAEAGSYSLVGCTVAPGFDFADFEIADRARLAERYPRHRALIERLTS